MDITLATFEHAPAAALRGVRFANAWAPSESYASSRRGVLTGQYPQRGATTRITDVFAEAGFEVREDAHPSETTRVFRLLEQPDPAALEPLSGVVAVCSLLGEPAPMSVWWPGVAEEGTSRELVSPMDIAPTLAAIAGLDVRPNARLSFDGLNLVPVLRYGASGHAALFFDHGVRMQDAALIHGTATPADALPRLQDEWRTWKGFTELGPLQ
ncbi:hypothetical protein ACKFRM_05485 [Corynebacterium sp. YSMAA1_1_D6]|uniref:hypothetical protein n=1 Tax=Corynebacterium sp. YSMAA1_1_D6 TaxID=3383589 RepID=UPI0038D08478